MSLRTSRSFLITLGRSVPECPPLLTLSPLCDVKALPTPSFTPQEILGGMLDLEPRRWRKPMRENFDDQRKKVLQFAHGWKPFDCTKTDG